MMCIWWTIVPSLCNPRFGSGLKNGVWRESILLLSNQLCASRRFSASWCESSARFLFVQGKSLYVLRHLVVLVQKQVLGSRAFMGVCWDLIQKWEELEPPIHRIPVPVSVVRAMTCISLHWGWRRFAGSVLSSFFAIMRPGEFLRAIRRDLVLPSDLLRNEEVPVFLRVREPKSRRRGATECSMLVYMTQPFVAASMFFSVNCLLTIPFIPLAQQAIEEDGIASCCTLASP